jgi:hypothetical protein
MALDKQDRTGLTAAKNEDPEKKKYFKIEKSSTAPAGASWSTEAVQRRQQQERAGRAARQRAHILQNHIRRSPVQRDATSSALLARETEARRTGVDAAWNRADEGHLGAAVWASGVVAKGSVPYASTRTPEAANAARYGNIPCFYVSAEDDKTGLGVAYVCKSALCFSFVLLFCGLRS